MNILCETKRRLREQKLDLEWLDRRVVPSTVHQGLIATDDTAAAPAASASRTAEAGVAAESKIVVNHDQLLATLANRREIRLERREAALERRDARLAKITALDVARDRFSPAVVREMAVGHAVANPPTAAKSGSRSDAASSARSQAHRTALAHVNTAPIKSVPVTPTTNTKPPTTTPATTITGTPNETTNPLLPDNVSTILDNIYQEYENGDLTSTNKPGQVEIQGTNVGVEMRTSSPSDFAAMVAAAKNLGLQVTTDSATCDIVVGFLPIADLPAVAQLTGSPAVIPLLNPETN